MTYAYELLPKLNHLILTGYDKEEGEYEFVGTDENWNRAAVEEYTLSIES